MIVPAETPLTEPYWAAARRGEVLLQRCAACAQIWHPAAPVCPACRSADWAWFAAAGTGRLISYTRVEHSAHPQVSAALPYVLVLVALDEGPAFLCGLDASDGAADAGLVSGASVRIGPGRAAGGLELPMARLT